MINDGQGKPPPHPLKVLKIELRQFGGGRIQINRLQREKVGACYRLEFVWGSSLRKCQIGETICNAGADGSTSGEEGASLKEERSANSFHDCFINEPFGPGLSVSLLPNF
ncbi:hypothetical protein TNCT_252241 [Trichonephila clavata]|uniref:Uncharacterized protein n=1 Tax=Trichonephila clavata TaxID=2740835 RepID=A0A8X6HEC5_TRICU|nr:hypothetical protein TNCT_252241 [Trichonephila clavata]